MNVAIQLRESGKVPALTVRALIQPAHRHSGRDKALVLDTGDSVLMSSRAMRLLLSKATIHLRIGPTVYEVRQGYGEHGSVKAQNFAMGTARAVPLPSEEP